MEEITDWNDIKKGKPLYVTHSVEVYRGTTKRTGQEVVTKEIAAINYEAAMRFMKEAYVLSSFDHHNVVKLYTCFLSTMKFGMISVVLVMEYCFRGDLQSEIDRRTKEKVHWPESALIQHLKDLVGVLAECESRNLAHRDIKPQNILLSEENGAAQLKLADFGFAFENWSASIVNNPRTMAGTPLFLSPKLKQAFLESGACRRVVHDLFKSDMYSLGLTFLSMADLKRIEYDTDLRKLQAKLNKKIDQLEYPKLKAIIWHMLRVDENERFNFTQLLKYMKHQEKKKMQVNEACIDYCKYANSEGARYIRKHLDYVLSDPLIKRCIIFKVYCREEQFISVANRYRAQLRLYIRNKQFQPFNKLFSAFGILGYKLQVVSTYSKNK